MTDYKQVPAYPTPEMIAALGFGGDVELAIGHAALSDDIERAYKAMLAAAPAVQVEPVAWIVRHPHFCGKFTDDKEIAAHWESKKQGCTTPLFHCSQPAEQQPAPDAAQLVEALQAADEYLSNNKFNQIGSGSILHRQMQDALAAYRKQAGVQS